MIPGATLGTEITMKNFVSGFDGPLFSQEKLVVGVLHVVPAAINSAGVPRKFQGVDASFKLQHRLLLPPITWVWPLPIEISIRIVGQSVQDELLGPLQNLTFLAPESFKNFSALGSVVIHLGPPTPPGKWQGNPNLPGLELLALLCKTNPCLLPV